MSTLTDVLAPGSTVGVGPVVGTLTANVHSHKAGWSRMLVNQLKHAGYVPVLLTGKDASWDGLDAVLIDHGMEFKGRFNLFGGGTDEVAANVERVLDGTLLFSYGCEMPDLGQLVRSRHRTGSPGFKALLERADDLTDACSAVQRIDSVDRYDRLCFGDSHALSQYEPGFGVSRNDGLTMHGAVTRGLDTWVSPEVRELRVYLGNIDVRHHLCRHEPDAVVSLVNRYMAELEKLAPGLRKVEVVHALPIETEDRRVPKSGWYRGTPFFGTRSERAAVAERMNKLIDAGCGVRGFDVIEHPPTYFGPDGELRTDVMERPQSVHISPWHYRWDLWNDEPNKR